MSNKAKVSLSKNKRDKKYSILHRMLYPRTILERKFNLFMLDYNKNLKKCDPKEMQFNKSGNQAVQLNIYFGDTLHPFLKGVILLWLRPK